MLSRANCLANADPQRSNAEQMQKECAANTEHTQSEFIANAHEICSNHAKLHSKCKTNTRKTQSMRFILRATSGCAKQACFQDFLGGARENKLGFAILSQVLQNRPPSTCCGASPAPFVGLPGCSTSKPEAYPGLPSSFILRATSDCANKFFFFRISWWHVGN